MGAFFPYFRIHARRGARRSSWRSALGVVAARIPAYPRLEAQGDRRAPEGR